MAPPLSLDLRKRIVAAYEKNEGTYGELAERFQVGEATVSRLLRRHRERGDLRPNGYAGGQPPRIPQEQYDILLELVAEKPDRTVAELSTEWRKRIGVRLSRSAMQRTLVKAGLSRKKSVSARRSSSGRTSRRSDAGSSGT